MTREELLVLVDARRGPIRRYLQWALENERRAGEEGGADLSMRMESRPDICDAAEAAGLFPERWWGLVVFTCFGSKLGIEIVAPHFQQPLAQGDAVTVLERISFPRGSVGHHRIQCGHKGARQALVSACTQHALFREVLHSDGNFDGRYRRLFSSPLAQWGRTTCFDLLLRAGALGVGEERYLPELAYLAGSTGPRKGFATVFGVAPDRRTERWAEEVLRTWAENWQAIAARVGVEWEGQPLYPRDQENFLCIYQEGYGKGPRCRPSRGARACAPKAVTGIKRQVC